MMDTDREPRCHLCPPAQRRVCLEGCEGENPIRFYRATGKYGFLSNLHPAEVVFEGRVFPTAEHAYQFGKFRSLEAAKWAMQAPGAHLVAVLAHGLLPWDIKEGWAQGKLQRMRGVLFEKFGQHPDLAEKLVATIPALLIEASKTDRFWGIGREGNGRNMLGRLLQEVRCDLGLARRVKGGY
jgi:ribA/ribD-fused uncharacterized protein